MTLLTIALVLPWATGALLVVLDGRRRAVAIAAIVALGATLASLVAVALTSGGHEVTFTTGGWPLRAGTNSTRPSSPIE